MERPGYRDKSRRQKPKGKRQKEGKASHFRTVWFGGFDETQTICYLWETVKSIEAVERDLSKTGAEYLGAEDLGTEDFGTKGLILELNKRMMFPVIFVWLGIFFLQSVAFPIKVKSVKNKR